MDRSLQILGTRNAIQTFKFQFMNLFLIYALSTERSRNKNRSIFSRLIRWVFSLLWSSKSMISRRWDFTFKLIITWTRFIFFVNAVMSFQFFLFTSLLAIVEFFKVVLISLTSTINKLLAFSTLTIKVKSGEIRHTSARFFIQVTKIWARLRKTCGKLMREHFYWSSNQLRFSFLLVLQLTLVKDSGREWRAATWDCLSDC